MIKSRGDLLIELIRQGGNGEAAQELIGELAAGYPVANLRRLFQSERDDTVKTGAWIASELGERVVPLLGDLSALLRHRLRYVRAFALDAVLVAASPNNGDVIAEAVRLIDDEDEGVRWKAMHFLSRASLEQLRASVRYLTDIKHAALVRWLLDVTANVRIADIIARSDDVIASKRLFAAAAAARVQRTTLAPLRHVTESQDAEISSFASEWLEMHNTF
jgi:hypothetical protein